MVANAHLRADRFCLQPRDLGQCLIINLGVAAFAAIISNCLHGYLTKACPFHHQHAFVRAVPWSTSCHRHYFSLDNAFASTRSASPVSERPSCKVAILAFKLLISPSNKANMSFIELRLESSMPALGTVELCMVLRHQYKLYPTTPKRRTVRHKFRGKPTSLDVTTVYFQSNANFAGCVKPMKS